MALRLLWNLALAGTTMFSLACASGGTHNISESSRDKVTSIEIDATPASSAYDLVNRLRPQWLRQGGTGSIGGGSIQSLVTLVYLDGSRIGTLEALRSISASGIRTMEWIPATRAAVVLTDVGSDAINGAISLRTK
jgi:hypothetical protein